MLHTDRYSDAVFVEVLCCQLEIGKLDAGEAK